MLRPPHARLRRSLSLRTIPLVLIAPLVVIGLVGCSLVPSPDNIVEGLVEEAAAQSGEDVDLDVDTSGDGASLPDGWPGLPVPEGRIVSAIKMGDSYSISIEVTSEDAARAVVDELAASGFDMMGETDYGELKGAMLTSPEWNVVYGWTASDEGIVVSYTVSPVAA
ncbi:MULTISPECIES: hypothetical protein [unclassified Microbacterium]|uniref:hypothetical protein n=1 Tax=unclassified Microbacterium TaxID=2609290 RepID=UPI000C2C0DA1|nr:MULTISPECIES: hypothetical protein [unclassified Microbacterium]